MKRKYILGLFFIGVAFSGLIYFLCLDRRPVIVWNMGEYWERDSEFEEYYNQLLKKYGCDYQVSFRRMEIPDDTYRKGGFMDICSDEIFETSDILTLPTDSFYSDYFGYYGIQGRFLELDEYMETEVGQRLYQAFPEKAWESYQIRDKIVGVGNLLPYRSMYIVLNQKYSEFFEKEGTDHTLEEWVKIAGMIQEQSKKKGVNTIGIVPYGFTWYPGAESLNEMSGIVIVKEDGHLKAKSLFHSEEYFSYLNCYYEGQQEGIASYEIETICAGDFGMMVYPGYSEESVVMELQKSYNWPIGEEFKAVPLKEWDIPFRGVGKKTVISIDTEQSDGAFEVLALSYSEPELTNALVYGIKDRDYFLEEGRVVYFEDNPVSHTIRTYGNSLLLTPLYYEPWKRAELLQVQLETERNSELNGFHFDSTKVEMEWNAVISVLLDHMALPSGNTDDLSREWEEVQSDLEQAGIEKVLSEMNYQLEEWERE